MRHREPKKHFAILIQSKGSLNPGSSLVTAKTATAPLAEMRKCRIDTPHCFVYVSDQLNDPRIPEEAPFIVVDVHDKLANYGRLLVRTTVERQQYFSQPADLVAKSRRNP